MAQANSGEGWAVEGPHLAQGAGAGGQRERRVSESKGPRAEENE